MVKSVEKVVKEVVEGKQQNIEIYFSGYYDVDQLCEVPNIEKHDDIAGYSVNGDWVAVMEKDSTTHVYPARGVNYIKHYTVKE